MQGFITETELDQANQVFPGIASYFASLAEKPRTFLDLVAAFDHWTDAGQQDGVNHPQKLVTPLGLEPKFSP